MFKRGGGEAAFVMAESWISRRPVGGPRQQLGRSRHTNFIRVVRRGISPCSVRPVKQASSPRRRHGGCGSDGRESTMAHRSYGGPCDLSDPSHDEFSSRHGCYARHRACAVKPWNRVPISRNPSRIGPFVGGSCRFASRSSLLVLPLASTRMGRSRTCLMVDPCAAMTADGPEPGSR